jgi:hypothetical protein
MIIGRQSLLICTKHDVLTMLDYAVSKRIEHCHVDVAVGRRFPWTYDQHRKLVFVYQLL